MKSLLLKIFSCLFFWTAAQASETISTKENAVSYTEFGSGPALILIHAFPTDKRLWQFQNEQLQKHFHVVSIDLRGFGHSETTDGRAISMEEYARQVKQVMSELHLSKAILGGESMGGYVALAFLEKYPSHVSGLILADTQSIADSAETKLKRENTARDILKNGTQKFIEGFLPMALTQNCAASTRELLEKILKGQSAPGMASALRGMAQRKDTSAVLARSKLPILIISGAEDKLISPAQSEHMHKLAKNSRYVKIPKAAHLSNLEQPKLWNEAVLGMFHKK